jgi:hypothetical protein
MSNTKEEQPEWGGGNKERKIETMDSGQREGTFSTKFMAYLLTYS